jgi:hypothetical protein
MRCSKCNNIIPDDSSFCPDCGTKVNNIAEMASKVVRIYKAYHKGYDHYAKKGCVPNAVFNFHDLSTEELENIIRYSDRIIQKHHEIEMDKIV